MRSMRGRHGRPGTGALAWLVAACVTLAAPAGAQLAGSNLLIGQLGNWPPSLSGRGTPDRESFYDRLDVQWLSGSVMAGARFETDRNSDAGRQDQFEYEGF